MAASAAAEEEELEAGLLPGASVHWVVEVGWAAAGPAMARAKKSRVRA